MPDFYVGYGGNPGEITRKLLETAKISEKIKEEFKVVIKPNLVVASKSELGATTHVEIVEAVIIYLKEICKVKSVTVAEGSWAGASTVKAFAKCGYDVICKKHGAALLDSKRDKFITVTSHGYELKICKTFVEADYLINVPVLKGHCQTDLTCCLKNLKGCIPDAEKRRYHSMGLHKPIAALACALRPHLHIVDSICGDLVFEEGGNPVEMNRVLLGFDPVLLDSWCAGLIGCHYEDIEYLRLAKEWGAGEYVAKFPDFEEFGSEERPKVPEMRCDIIRRLEEFVDEDGACSACYAALMFALSKTGGRMLWGEKIKIGQGFKDKPWSGYGVGECASGCDAYVKGCPPRAVDIVDFIARL